MAQDLFKALNERRKQPTEEDRKRSITISVIVMIVVVCLVALSALVGFLTDWMWFKDLN